MFHNQRLQISSVGLFQVRETHLIIVRKTDSIRRAVFVPFNGFVPRGGVYDFPHVLWASESNDVLLPSLFGKLTEIAEPNLKIRLLAIHSFGLPK